MIEREIRHTDEQGDTVSARTFDHSNGDVLIAIESQDGQVVHMTKAEAIEFADALDTLARTMP